MKQNVGNQKNKTQEKADHPKTIIKQNRLTKKFVAQFRF